MRRYTVRVNETDHVIDVEELAADTFTVHLSDGRLVDVVLTDHQDLAQAMITPQLEISHPRLAAPAPEPRQVADVPRPTAQGTPPVRRGAPGAGGAAKNLTAPMPGVILSVAVAAGDIVKRGQTLMVLEAMKMKNDLKAQRDGTVAQVFVNAGEQVKHSDVLLEFES